MSFDRILIARLLFSLVTAGWGVLTVVADFNKTHATNPAWTPHASFHVVWQVLSYMGFGLLAFALIWWPGPLAVERLYFVALMGAIVYAAFVAALIAMMVVVGGLTRLTGSGLSITEWQPVTGVIPPLNQADWQAEFAKYQGTPQYELLNRGMGLAAFRPIRPEPGQANELP